MVLFPLSLNQQNIWHVECAFPGTSINAICTTVRITGRIDFLLLQQAVDTVLRADISLRTRLTLKEGEPMQYHAPYQEERIQVYDFSMTDETGVEHWATTLAREPITLLNAPLYSFAFFRINEHTAGILVKTHHIISDGWSQALLVNRIGQLYLDLLAGKEIELEELPDYAAQVEAEQTYLHSPAYARDRSFWQEQLSQEREPAALKAPKGASISAVGRRKTFRLPQVLAHAVDTFCREKRMAPFTVFYMMLAIYLKRIGGRDNATIGVPVYNRTNYLFKQTTGMFVSTLPFAARLSDEWSLNEFSNSLTERWLDVLRHQRFPFSHMNELRAEGSALFHMMLSFQNSKLLESDDASVFFSGHWLYSGYQSEHLCIHITNIDGNCKYDIDYDYLTQIFSDQEIEELHNYICRILSASLAAPDMPVRALPLLGVNEREQVLYTFNQTARPVRGSDLYSEFLQCAQSHAQRVALIENGRRTTYAKLRAMASKVAAALPEANALVAILLPRSTELYAAMTGVMQAGCAWVLLSPELPSLRIREILRLSGAAYLISKHDYTAMLGDSALPVVDMEALPETEGEIRFRGPQELAYVVYTSGSTGHPKGVEISVQNLLNLSQAMRPLYATGAVLSLANIGFDVFMLESVVALLNAQTIILPMEEELESPAALSKLITDYRAGFLAVTPSRLTAMMSNPLFTKALASMESIVCGGESFPNELLQRLQLHTTARVYNQYGPSETTVAVSYLPLNNADLITIGRPMDNCRLYVLDEWLNPLPIGVYGALYVGGLCVGLGYHNAAELTEQSFIPSPFELGERLYRTGDIACWTAQGEIMLSGRDDRQVKVRGLRVEPQEIAACLANFPGVTAAAARVWEVRGQNLLIGYYTSGQSISEAELLDFAATYLPRYMLPVRVLRMASFPMSVNGKVNEAQLPPPNLEDNGAVAPDAAQRIVLDVFRTVLHCPQLQPNDDYFLWGGNSLNAMETIAALEEKTGRRLRVATLYACRTAMQLGEYLQDAVPPATGTLLRRAQQLVSYPLTPVQRGIYFECSLHPDSTAYHMPGAFCPAVPFDAERLEEAIKQLIAGDEVLRASFVARDGQLVCQIAKQVDFALEQIIAADLEAAFAQFIRAFDLSRAPLLRAALWQDPAGKQVLLLDIHHLICDGMSTPLLLARLDALYQGQTVSVPLSFLDYACYLDAQIAEKDSYWQEQLAALPLPAELPAELPRAETLAPEGAAWNFALTEEQSRAVEDWCRSQGLTPFMLFSGVYGILLAGLIGSRDLAVGTPVAGRSLPGLETVCGPLLNTLPLRLRPSGLLEDYFRAVKSATLGLLDHQSTALETIISQLGLRRELGKNPLYRAMFSLRPLDAKGFSFAGAPLTFMPAPKLMVKAELSLEAWQDGSAFQFCFAYAASLFTPAAIELYANSFVAILTQVLAGQVKTAEEICLLSARDRLLYFDKPNRCRAPYCSLPVPQLIAEAAWLNPAKPAVIWHGQQMSYGALAERAAELCGILRAHGVQPGDRVGLCCSRTPDMLASLWAILKAGAAYVPFLPSYPAARIQYMLENAEVKLTLADPLSRESLGPDFSAPVALTTEQAAPVYDDAPLTGEETMYILYTSGSTGRPKGVQLPHRALSNLLESMRELMQRHPGPVLCATNITFDIFISETLLALAQGYPIVLADEEEMLLPWRLAGLMTKYHTTITQFTPSRLQMCLANEAFALAAREIEFVILVGENVPPQLVEKFKQCSQGRFVNMYGPTEAAVYVTAGELSAAELVHIGVPLINCRIYVLDEQLHPALPTTRGELYLAGECLADGYVNNAEKTAEAFVADPFFKGERMYKSGDLGRLRTDGTLECFGRVDHQIKINGNRVELSEITGALVEAGAKDAAALPETNADGSVTLTAFVTPQTLDLTVVRESLRRTLPDYLLPGRMIALAELPHNASGKLDLPLLRELAKAPVAEAPAAGQGVEPVPATTAAIPAAASAAKETTQVAAMPAAEMVAKAAPLQAPAIEAVPMETAKAETAPIEEATSIEEAVVPAREQADSTSAAGQGEAPSLAALKLTPAVVTAADMAPLAPETQLAEEVPTVVPSMLSKEEAAASSQGTAAEIPSPAAKQAVASAPAASAASAQHAATLAATAETLLALWEKVLGRSGLQAEVSFFEQGGTSLGALSVLSEYFNQGLELTLAQFYQHPTAKAQATLFSAEGERAQIEATAIAVDQASVVPIAPVAPVAPDAVVPADTSAMPAAITITEEKRSAVAAAAVRPAKLVAPAANAELAAPAATTISEEKSNTVAAAVAAKPAAGQAASATVSSETYPSQVPQQAVREESFPRRVFLTGATGYLGAHLLRELLDQGTEEIFCLVRGSGRERLLDVLSWYFGQGWTSEHASSLQVVSGDLNRPQFGLDAATYAQLTASVDAVYHSAADVRHYLSEQEALATNLFGTQQVVQFALSAGAVLHHMSTASIAADHLLIDPATPAVFSEYNFDIGQNWRDNVYLKTKFLAEHAVYQALSQGLRARVYRIGRLVGRISDGVFQKNPWQNAFYQQIHGVVRLSALPESMALIQPDMTAVDIAARAIVTLYDAPLTAYHIAAPVPLALAEALRVLLPALRVLEDKEFAALLAKEAIGQGEALAPLIDVWNSGHSARHAVALSTAATQAQLEQRGFIWPAPLPSRELAAFLK